MSGVGGSTLWPGGVPHKARTDTLFEDTSWRRLLRAIAALLALVVAFSVLAWLLR